jgi:branched-chain amino acid transport system ATP-binding protein
MSNNTMTAVQSSPETNTLPLEIKNLCKSFGGLRACSDVNFQLKQNSLTGLIGPNGAGKTTVFNLITGVYLPTEGEVLYNGVDISGLPPHTINQMGIARTFQNIRLFPNLTVLDNVRIAYHPHAGYNLFDSIVGNQRFQHKDKELTEKAVEFLSVFNLHDRLNETAKNLPYGEQRRLEIARALASEPKLLLLDEPQLA